MMRAWAHALLLLVPLLVYSPTVFHEYGFRDDYAHLREAREIPAHLVRFTASYGRPIYGALLVATVAPLGGEVAHLQWLRLGSVLLLTLIAVVLARLLQGAGWPAFESAAVGLAVALLPAAQVTVGWSIAWPLALAVLISLAGFAATDRALTNLHAPRLGMWALGFAAYLAAGLIYQPSALFFVVPLAARLLVRPPEQGRERAIWTAAHLATALGALAAGFMLMRTAFTLGLLKQSGVIAIETDLLGKLAWFVSLPLADALALVVLRDRFATPWLFWIAVAFTVALIAWGLYRRPRRQPADTWAALFCVLALPFVAFGVNLAASLRVPSYRTTYALAGLVLVLPVHALVSLQSAGRISRKVGRAALAVFLVGASLAASYHAYALIARPQGWEWQIMREAAAGPEVRSGVKVYVIQTTWEDRGTERIFADEFGSLSSDTDWAVSEMFKCALRRRFPEGLPAGFRYRLDSGRMPPPPGMYDLVIDMRALSRHRAGGR